MLSELHGVVMVGGLVVDGHCEAVLVVVKAECKVTGMCW